MKEIVNRSVKYFELDKLLDIIDQDIRNTYPDIFSCISRNYFYSRLKPAGIHNQYAILLDKSIDVGYARTGIAIFNGTIIGEIGHKIILVNIHNCSINEDNYKKDFDELDKIAKAILKKYKHQLNDILNNLSDTT